MPLPGPWLAGILVLITARIQIFDRLKKGVDPKLQEEKTRLANERELAQFEKAQRRLGELVILLFSFCPISTGAMGAFVEFSANILPRYKTTLHYLLQYPQYASSMLQTHEEASLIESSIQSSVPIKTVLIL